MLEPRPTGGPPSCLPPLHTLSFFLGGSGGCSHSGRGHAALRGESEVSVVKSVWASGHNLQIFESEEKRCSLTKSPSQRLAAGAEGGAYLRGKGGGSTSGEARGLGSYKYANQGGSWPRHLLALWP